MSGTSSAETIDSIQVLRALAALGVAATHYGLFYSYAAGDPRAFTMLAAGEAGVDLFFVISGFIMVYASQPLYGAPHASGTFFARRLIRIVPIYWLFTTLYLLAAFAAPQFGKDISPDFVLASYLFIPYPREDGGMQPLVGQGWSLNYEMLFYVIFALALFAPRRIAIILACLVVTAIGMVGFYIDIANPLLRFWASEIVIEFAFGMLIGFAYLEGLRLPRWLGWTLMLTGVGLLLAGAPLHAAIGGRILPWGIPATIAVAGAALGNPSASGALWRWLIVIGEASYALYLCHAIAIRGVLTVLRKTGLELSFWAGLPLALAICIVMAIAIYYGVERPVTRSLRNRFHVARGKPRKVEALPI
ncbi:MAG: acyltransferase family protein [Pseudorhodoplanes sp.]